eukprot:m.835 g.835  ORF g.835 m.835 type:complete len:169 (-) comp494_c0_seq2:149-655(-)
MIPCQLYSKTSCPGSNNSMVSEYYGNEPTRTLDSVCRTVRNTCPPGQFISSEATRSSDILCQQIRSCLNSEFEFTKPNLTRNRECMSLTQCKAFEYELVPPLRDVADQFNEHDRVCTNISGPCSLGEFELSSPNPTQDRQASCVLRSFPFKFNYLSFQDLCNMPNICL